MTNDPLAVEFNAVAACVAGGETLEWRTYYWNSVVLVCNEVVPMELRPLDILNKSFHRSIRGYDSEAVDSFLKQVSAELENSLAESDRLQNECVRLNDELNRYKQIESTLTETLVLAQRTADDLRANARKEADLIVREARTQVEGELRAARQELEDLRKLKDRFAAEMRALLRSYMELNEGLDGGRATATEHTGTG